MKTKINVSQLENLEEVVRVYCTDRKEVDVLKKELDRLGYLWRDARSVFVENEKSFEGRYYFAIYPTTKWLLFNSQPTIEEYHRFTHGNHSKKKSQQKLLDIEEVIYNEEKRTTVVLWKDKTKTKVTCSSEDVYSKENGLAMCFAKRCLGNSIQYHKVFKEWGMM